MKKESNQNSLLSTINTGFNDVEPTKQLLVASQQAPTLYSPYQHKTSQSCCSNNQQNNEKFKNESIKNTVNTGFNKADQLVVDCPEHSLVTPLLKENFLSEFREKTEKQLARQNLDIYSRTEVDNLVNYNITLINNNFVKKSELENIIEGLGYVDSTLKSYIDYQIPEELFKL